MIVLRVIDIRLSLDLIAVFIFNVIHSKTVKPDMHYYYCEVVVRPKTS